jgi:hypothetical protein
VLSRAVQLMQLSDSIKEGLQPGEYEDDKEYAQVYNMTMHMHSHYIFNKVYILLQYYLQTAKILCVVIFVSHYR